MRRPPSAHRAHGPALRGALLPLPPAARLPRHIGNAAGAAPRRERGDQHPRRSACPRLRPRLHRLTDVVLKTSVPIRTFLKSDAAGVLLDRKRFAAFVVCRRYWSINLKAVKKLGAKKGGDYVDGIHFSFAGGQVRSLLSLLSYFGHGENRERYLRVRIPPTNLKPDFREQARAFANELADGLNSSRSDDSLPAALA